MVKNLARGMAVLCLVLPLASCIFFFSAFSPLLSQVVARTDLSSVIPAGSARDYEIYCVTATAAPAGEFVLLMNRNASAEPRVIVLDSNLNLIQKYVTSPQLDGWAGGSFSGSTIMEGADGNIEIGTLGFSADELRTAGLNPSWVNKPVHSSSFSSPLRQKNVINFDVPGGNVLVYGQWQWWSTNDFNAMVTIQGIADTQFRVQGVYNITDSPTAGSVILALREDSNSTVHFVAIPLTDICANIVAMPLLDKYPHARHDQVDTSSVGFAGDCLVAYSYRDHAMVRYSLTPPFDVISTLSVGQGLHQAAYGYKADGSYMVRLDQATLELEKVAKWW